MKILTDSVHSIFLNMMGIIVSFIINILLANHLGASEIGIYTLVITISTLIVNFSSLGMGNAGVYMVNKSGMDYKDTFASLFWFGIVWGSFLNVVLLLLISSYPALLKNLELDSVIKIGIAIPLGLTNTFLMSLALAKQRIKQTNNIRLVTSIIQVLLISILFMFKQLTLNISLNIYLFTMLLSSIFIVIKNRSFFILRPKIYYDNIIKLARYGSKIIIGNIALILNLQLDILILGILSFSSEVGVYSVGIKFSNIILLIPNVVGPILYSHWSTDDVKLENVLSVLRPVFQLTFTLAVIVGIFSKFVIPFLYGDEFLNAIWVVWILAFGVGLMSITYVISNVFSTDGRPGVSSMVLWIGLAVNVIFNLIFIPQFGAVGAAIASLISYTTISIATLFAYSHIYHVSVKIILSQLIKPISISEIIFLIKNRGV